MVEMSQVNLPANARRTFMSTVFIPDAKSGNITSCRWAPFPFEISGASLIVPSPSGERLLIVRDNDGKTTMSQAKLEIWGQGQLLKEMHVPASVHGSVYSDEWYIYPLKLYFYKGFFEHSNILFKCYTKKSFPALSTFGMIVQLLASLVNLWFHFPAKLAQLLEIAPQVSRRFMERG